MTEIFLDEAQIDPGFQEVDGVGVSEMAQGVGFGYSGLPESGAEGVLDTGFGHGFICVRHVNLSSSGSRKEQMWVVMSLPMLS
jgi:hypothetical protein